MRLMHWMFAVCLLTASCDIALVFDIGGTLRLSQILMVFVVVGALGKVAQRGTILWPQGGMSIVIWCLVQVLFLVVSLTPGVGASYYLLLFFTIFGVFAVLQLYGKSDYIDSLMKIYLVSYVLIAFFGLFQLVSPSLHLGSYFVAQWLLRGKIPRINGFCYEPSYYATYLVMGWIMVLDLRASKAKITSSQKWKWFAITIGAAMFLSTSRTAWIVMVLEGVVRGVPSAYRKLKLELTKIGSGNLRIQRPRVGLFVIGLVLVGVFVAGALQLASIINPNILLNGTGLNHTASHSVSERSGRSVDTFGVFLDHPWMGQSLTGVASQVAELHGHNLSSVEELRVWWGFPVILEVLAASGVVGFIPFLWFFGTITIGTFGLIRQRWPEERAKWLRALVRALIFECIILLADQNLLRMYLWFHVTMVVVVAFQLRHWQRSEDHSRTVVALA
ncbi:O-antigen ligase family protein [Tunturiibacter lichenicola]|uniref:O-antigen ligase family protein n=1 Tax=Tunturiibacter lichenicola TaxID=2051959 RepID=UPI0021B25F2E|nr:O-antigen ligase family protein [Edaphobacter lichenicola]